MYFDRSRIGPTRIRVLFNITVQILAVVWISAQMIGCGTSKGRPMSLSEGPQAQSLSEARPGFSLKSVAGSSGSLSSYLRSRRLGRVLSAYCGHRIQSGRSGLAPAESARKVGAPVIARTQAELAARGWLAEKSTIVEKSLPQVCLDLFDGSKDWKLSAPAQKEWTGEVSAAKIPQNTQVASGQGIGSEVVWVTLWGPRVSFQKRDLQDLGDYEVQNWLMSQQGELIWRSQTVCGALEGAKVYGCDEKLSQFSEILQEQLKILEHL